jgi:hypothetical protein
MLGKMDVGMYSLDVRLAGVTLEAREALAGVVCHGVDAGPSVEAGLGLALTRRKEWV